ncbi:MAG TPA: hypothetical protein VLF90_03915 [Patescibacteria group bacterium]|nr:hypothetical protein [Patescibacteria group bacterium]
MTTPERPFLATQDMVGQPHPRVRRDVMERVAIVEPLPEELLPSKGANISGHIARMADSFDDHYIARQDQPLVPPISKQ